MQQNQGLAQFFTAFRALDDRDQDICRLTALGITSREIGEQPCITRRAVDLRKQRVFATLGVAKTVDLARTLVRVQERGYLNPGL